MKQFLILLIPFVFFDVFAHAQDSMLTVGTPHAQNQKKFIEVYGHRGAQSYSPENTIPGYRTALKIGVDWVDMDIVVTKDEQIVAYHDMTLNSDLLRNPNGTFVTEQTPIHSLTFQQLQKYDAGMLNPTSMTAKLFPLQVPVNGTRIPSLQETIDYVNQHSNKQVNFQFEIKTDPKHDDWSVTPERFAQILYNILKKNKIIDRVEIQAFDWRYLTALQKLDKNIKTAYLMEESTNVTPKQIKELGGSCYEPSDIDLTEAQLIEAHKLGLKVVVWSWASLTGYAFSPLVVERLIDWGVDGIITNDPAQLNAMLAARGYRVPKNYLAQ